MRAVIDIGGTTTRIGLGVRSQVNKVLRFDTPETAREGVEEIISGIKALAGSKKVKEVVIASAGIIDKRAGKLSKSPNLKKWVGKSIVSLIKKNISAKVYLANDAAVAALGEAHFGSGINKRIIGYLTIGTGVGGARIVDGRIDAASQGFEPGYQVIVPNGRKGPYGQKGCLESYVSGRAYIKYKPSWASYASYLGQGIVNLIHLWSPDVIVLGGGFVRDKKKYFIKLSKDYVRKNSLMRVPPIVSSNLGDLSAIYGGLVYKE